MTRLICFNYIVFLQAECKIRLIFLFIRTTAMFDIIYTGGGLSALLSAYYMVQYSPKRLSLLFIDSQETPLSHKTFSYWSSEPVFPQQLVYKQWDKVAVEIDGNTRKSQTPQRYAYKTIKGRDLEEYLKKYISSRATVVYRNEKVITSFDEQSAICVVTDCAQYKGLYVFNSILAYDALYSQAKKKGHSLLTQYFVGVEIETAEPVFCEEEITLADFRMNHTGGYLFGYILPYSATHALVELVDDKLLDITALHDYLKSVLGIHAYTITYTEQGSNVLTSARFPRFTSGRIINIGNAGGMLKATTGYALTNILDDARYLAKMFSLEGGINHFPSQKSMYRFFDRMFLYVLAENRFCAKKMFTRLFFNVPIDDVFAFLDEKASLRQVVKILNAMSCCAREYIRVRLFKNQPVRD